MSESVHSICPMRSHPERSESSAQPAIRGADGSLLFVRALLAEVKRAREMGLAVLREIFDESAYTRFLDRNQLEHSRSNYAAFRCEHEDSKAHRPRCC